LDELIEEITTDAYGDEGYWAFLTAFEHAVSLPMKAKVIGETVEVMKIKFDGNERRGLTATVLRKGHRSSVSLLDVKFPARSEAARYVAAYWKWLGVS
jgi:hypothetical protein